MDPLECKRQKHKVSVTAEWRKIDRDIVNYNWGYIFDCPTCKATKIDLPKIRNGQYKNGI